MISKIVLFILGILMCSYSIMLDIIYINLIKMGYSLVDYLKYIVTSLDCLLIIPGIILILISLKKKKQTSIIL